MADLKALFSKKAPDANAPTAESVSKDESGQVPPAPAADSTTTPKPANPFARAGNSGSGGSSGQPSGRTPTGSNDASSGGESKSGLSALPIGAAARDSGVNSGGVASAPINSLESLDSTEDAGIEPRGTGVSYFADETPATKPTRELPEGLSKESLGFLDMLDSVYNVIHDPELLGGVITNIMVELKSNPEYTRLIAPDDVRVMVRGMRESMGLARVKKTEAKAKRTGAGGKRGSKIVDADMLADLDSFTAGIS